MRDQETVFAIILALFSLLFCTVIFAILALFSLFCTVIFAILALFSVFCTDIFAILALFSLLCTVLFAIWKHLEAHTHTQHCFRSFAPQQTKRAKSRVPNIWLKSVVLLYRYTPFLRLK
jgi:hypothetical protein